ncbi:Na+/H+ antiporter subunit E [Croceibacterium sp. LX-88]|uniref:Na+/H+ antiporter subunit E n=1 Tax=Croceibacterium selenioxidans TaxID=2838833 RepID=A0ABS5W5A0_9SPHN|nr:Na+/H+ antiporter subunit E [Croceibacterium selenioxidans]MBT2134473.1 Na+/H+ antiporter subunit E [Croceibacterium selenioxidans]
MKRWLHFPFLALAMLAMWLLLAQSLSPGQILLGTVAALLATHALKALRPEKVRLGSPKAILKLLSIVLADIVRSNFAVAAIVAFPRQKRVTGFVSLPLELQSRAGLAVLALIITATPGTVWVDLDRRRNRLLVHVLDLVDEQQWVSLIKERYEALLVEIFDR